MHVGQKPRAALRSTTTPKAARCRRAAGKDLRLRKRLNVGKLPCRAKEQR